MRPLRYFRWWLLLGWLIVLAVVYLSLSTRPAIDIPVRFGDKVGHFLAYGVLMGWFVQLYQSRILLLLHAALLVLLGVGLEFLQGYSGRYFEYADMAANSAGVLVGFSLCFTPLQVLLQRFEACLFSRR